MAMRRPRIKASANLLSIKRKPKAAVATPIPHELKQPNQKDLNVATEKSNDHTENNKPQETVPIVADICALKESHKNGTSIEKDDSGRKPNVQPAEDILPSSSEVAFKQPTKIENYRPAPGAVVVGSPLNITANKSEDGYNSDIDNVMQMDLQRTANGFPMSPTKQQTRPRIRPSPIIGQRRNSYVGFSPSPHTATAEESSNEFIMPSPRRERHQSQSLTNSSAGATQHKYMPSMLNGRTRTDSNCSAFSDVVAITQTTANPFILTKMRKSHTNEVCNNRTNWLKDYESRCPNGVPDKTRLKMLDLIYYNPTTNPMNKPTDTASNPNNSQLETPKMEESDDKKANSAPVPQLKLNANNELVLDDKSLEIETTGEQEARKLLAQTSLVVVDENTGTNGFYKRQKRTREWPHEETIKFFRCLQTVGTDFSLMVQLFPNRSRRDLKLKFKKEERSNGALINKALLYPTCFDIDQLKQQLENDEIKHEEEQRKLREIEARTATKIQKVPVKLRCERPLQNGQDIYENENVPRKQMSSRAKKTPKTCANEIPSNDQQPPQVQQQSLENPTTVKPLKRKYKKKDNHSLNITDLDKKTTETEINEATIIKLESHEEERKRENEIVNEQLEHELAELLEVEDTHQNKTLPEVSEPDKEVHNDHANDQCEATATTIEHSFNECKDETDYNLSLNETVMEVHDEHITDDREEIIITTDHNYIECEDETEESLALRTTNFVGVEQADIEEEEDTIQSILKQIEEGGLMLVSSLDPSNRVIHEIFMIDKETGDLGRPLELPDDIIQSIVELAT